MRTRTLVALGLSAAVLGAHVLLFERDGDDAERPAGRVLPGLDRGRVERIRIARRGEAAVALARRPEGGWAVAPAGHRADREAVDRLLSALEFLERRRAVAEASNPRQLGLAPAQVKLTLEGRGLSEGLALGRPDPSGYGVYLSHGGQVLVVDREILSLLDRDPSAWRDRDLVPMEARLIRTVRIRRGAGEIRLFASTGGWRLASADGATRADPGQVSRLVTALADLRATRLLEKPLGGAAEIRVELGGAGADKTLRIVVGGACPGQPRDRLVGVGAVSACVPGEDLAPLALEREALVDRFLTHRRETELRRIRIQRGGRALSLERAAEKWHIEGDGEADPLEVAGWLEGLAQTRGELVAEKHPASGSGAHAWRSVELVPERGAPEVLRFSPDGALVRRDDEPTWLRVDPARTRQLVEVDVLRFRSRQLLSLSHHLVRRIETERSGEREVVALRDGQWSLVEPVQAPADPHHVAELLRRLSELRAVKLLPGKPPAGSRVITMALVTPREVLAPKDSGVVEERRSLWVAFPATGPCLARSTGPWGELDPATCAVVAARRADPHLLRFDEVDLRRIEIEIPGRRVAIEKRGPAWVEEAQGEAVPSARLADLVRELRGLRGPVLSYRASTLAAAWIRIRLGMSGGGERTIVVDRQGRAAGEAGRVIHALAPEQVKRLEQIGAAVAAAR